MNVFHNISIRADLKSAISGGHERMPVDMNFIHATISLFIVKDVKRSWILNELPSRSTSSKTTKNTERTWCPLSFPFSGAPSSPTKVRWLLHHSICCTRYFKARASKGDLSDGLSNYLHRSGALVDTGAWPHCQGWHRSKCSGFRPPLDGCGGLFCNRPWAQVLDVRRTIPQVGARRKIPVLPSRHIEVRTGRCHRQQPGQSATLQMLTQKFAAGVVLCESCQRSLMTLPV
jgi:hypothetical protein